MDRVPSVRIENHRVVGLDPLIMILDEPIDQRQRGPLARGQVRDRDQVALPQDFVENAFDGWLAGVLLRRRGAEEVPCDGCRFVELAIEQNVEINALGEKPLPERLGVLG